MNQTLSIPSSITPSPQSASSPLWKFITQEKSNLTYLIIAACGCTLEFFLFKLLYPYPDFISDSRSYIETNLYHMNVNLWPIGYSKFLLLVHTISHSDTFLVGAQYFILEASLAYFYFTIRYLFHPLTGTSRLLFVFLFLNPLFLYLSNFVLSDAIFAALTVTFLTQFLWLLKTPSLRLVLIQAIIVGLAFTIRYTALYYPLVSIIGLLLSRLKWPTRIAGLMTMIFLITPFYLFTKQQTKEITGTSQFSVFGGWQVANNALYMYDLIRVDSTLLPAGTEKLDRLARTFFKSVPPQSRELQSYSGTFFIKAPFGVLKPYMESRYSYDDPISQFRAWGAVSPLYEKYGAHLIIHHPFAFAQCFLWLNAKNYFLPHLEKFDVYNNGKKRIDNHIQDWFDYISPYVQSISPTLQGKICYGYPILFMILNIYFLAGGIWYLTKKQYQRLTVHFRLSFLFMTTFLVINFAFSILATIIVLRYEIVPLIILFSFFLLLLESPRNNYLANHANTN